jgi:hypothetical protein
LTLDSPSDKPVFSSPLTKLELGASIEVDVVVHTINAAPGERYGHAFDFWFVTDPKGPIDLYKAADLDGALGFRFLGGSRWDVGSHSTGTGFVFTTRTVTIPLNSTNTVRLRRTANERAQIYLNGQLLHEISSPIASRIFYVRAQGAKVTYTYREGLFGYDVARPPMILTPPAPAN